MSRSALSFVLISILSCSVAGFSQPKAPPPKAQTARQALIEIITRGRQGIEKHLTVEVQNLLKSDRKAALAVLAMFDAKLEPGFETFDTGGLLLAYTEPGKNLKFEIHVENDDFVGDEDTLLLSIHTLREGKEEEDMWALMSSRFTVSMKLEQNIWRLNKVSVSAELPVGDSNFVEKTLLKEARQRATGLAAVTPTVHTDIQMNADTDPRIPPEQVITMLGAVELSFARLHPETGFTCSLSELSEGAKVMGIDEQVIIGSYKGYHFVLSGCEGKPAGSYQIVAEPLVLTKGAQAFCTDATGNVRFSDDGHGATCLISGKVQHEESEDTEMIGSQIPGGEAKPAK